MNLLFCLLTIFRVALVGDPQVDNDKELSYARQSIYRELRERTDLDLVIVLGDLVNENVSLIEPSEATLDSLRCPWVRVNGNHDGPSPVADTTFSIGGIRFVLMDNVRRVRRGGYEGGFSARQKAWLDSLARRAPASEKFVLCTHIPISESKGRDTLSNILSGRSEVLFVSGHTHQVNRQILERGVEEVVAGATCGTWWRGVRDAHGIPYALMNCGAPRGYFIADFETGTRSAKRAGAKKPWYTLDYKCVDRTDKYSLSVVDGALIINVFGGSREGNVEVKILGEKGRGRRSGWLRASHWYGIAPEVDAIIKSNREMSREYRKAHKDEFLPFLTTKSPHLWRLELTSELTAEAVSKAIADGRLLIRYSDPVMTYTIGAYPQTPAP